MKKIGWVVPFPNVEGSGGIKTIFDHIKCLENIYEQDIYINYNPDYLTSETVSDLVKNKYGLINNSTIRYGHNDIKNSYYDLLMATFSLHAFRLRGVEAKNKAYFIQDLEHLFFEAGSNYLYAKESYKYGFTPITIGKYLKRKMEDDFDYKDVKYYDFCADLNIYKPLNIEKENAIAFLYQPEKPRRCADIGIKALRILKQLLPETKIYVYGSNEIHHDLKGFINLRLIKLDELNKLYNKCKIVVCANPTNPSRIPFEVGATKTLCYSYGGENNSDDLTANVIVAQNSSCENTAIDLYKILCSYGHYENSIYTGWQQMENRDLQIAFGQFRNIIDGILK